MIISQCTQTKELVRRKASRKEIKRTSLPSYKYDFPAQKDDGIFKVALWTGRHQIINERRLFVMFWQGGSDYEHVSQNNYDVTGPCLVQRLMHFFLQANLGWVGSDSAIQVSFFVFLLDTAVSGHCMRCTENYAQLPFCHYPSSCRFVTIYHLTISQLVRNHFVVAQNPMGVLVGMKRGLLSMSKCFDWMQNQPL